MRNFIRLIAAIAVAVTLAHAARADSSAAAAWQGVITQQLSAFAGDRDAEAYSYAAPVVQLAFPSVESFMAMVRQGYQPVLRNSGHRFGESGTDATGRPTQTVILQGMDGKTYEARYTLEQQPDGIWKIAGCVIKLLAGTNV